MCRILHIEDSGMQKTLIAMIFAKADWESFQLTWVASMAEAKVKLATEAFDIIIADLNLPDSDRADTINTIRGISPDTPIIAVSCEEDYEIAMQTIRDGVDYFISKNHDLKLLPMTVLTVLEKRRISKETRETFVKATKDSLGEMSKEMNKGLDRTIAMAKKTSAKLARYKEQGLMYG